MSGQITVGCIVTIGKARTLWEVEATHDGSLLNLVKVDGDGYVTLSRRPEAVVLRALPCQNVTLSQLIRAKDEARAASLAVAEKLRLWPAPSDVNRVQVLHARAISKWEYMHDLHYSGRKAQNIEKAVAEFREEAKAHA